jgi:coenzyme F420-0:L-glutamate ligase/coenzyme F420-1:gamma-L-glutamate ligase
MIGSLDSQGVELQDGDIIIVTHKIVSKAEGRIRRITDVTPSDFAKTLAKVIGKDARLVEIILQESKRLIKVSRRILICETKHGFICANAGVDQSNVPLGTVTLLPVDADASAENLRRRLRRRTGVDLPVIISDTFGRPWREGQVNVAIGVSGLTPIKDYRGFKDKQGYELRVTQIAVADHLASAAELVMGKTDEVPAVLIRGAHPDRGRGSAKQLIRRADRDLFR